MKTSVLTVLGLATLIWPRTAPAQNAVTYWNDIAVTTALAGNSAIPPNSPNGMTLYLAYVHLAIHDAVNAIVHRYRPYGTRLSYSGSASVEAAVATAAYETLRAYFPDQSEKLTAQYIASLSLLPDDGKTDGVNAGLAAADQLIALRRNDGHGAPVPYSYPAVPTPGVWIPTPPAFAAPVTPWMGQMVPFTMSSASQFFPGPPPSLASKEWADDYNQVKALGVMDSPVRTPRQTETGLFWTENTAVQYARALRNLAGARGVDIADTARLFALVWTASADALIGCWNAKFQYSFWRPVTAIRNGGIDGNSATEADPGWTPLGGTPTHPEYPSAHGCFTGAFATSLKSYFGNQRFTFVVSSNVTKTVHEMRTMRELEQEIENARVYAGIHFHHSVTEGESLGIKVAEQTARNFFGPDPGK